MFKTLKDRAENDSSLQHASMTSGFQSDGISLESVVEYKENKLIHHKRVHKGSELDISNNEHDSSKSNSAFGTQSEK
jgi:hypothetical protein